MVDRDPRSDAALLAATAVDPEAFGVFYRRHAPWVLRYVARRVDDRDVVGDLVSEIFASALISLPKFDESRGTPSAWLVGIAAHQLSRYRRRGVVSQRAQRRLGLERVVLTDAELEAVEAHDVVSVLLAVLPGEQRDAVEARVVDERSYPEIAQHAGVSESVARQRSPAACRPSAVQPRGPPLMADFHTQLADQLVGAASKKRRMRFARSRLPQLDGALTTLAVLAALTIGVGMLISMTATPTEEARPASSDAILNAPLERVDGGGSLRLADLRGRPTLVSWTASWCEPCRGNEASLALAAGRGLNVVVIAHHDSTAAAKALSETLTAATVVTDESDRLFDSFPLSGVPATRALDAAGQIVESWDGPITTADVEDLATQQPAP